MIMIKILGPGCSNCKKLEEVVNKAVTATGVQASITKVTAQKEILSYDILSTPALVINGKVVSSGRIPGPVEIAQWLTAA